MATQALVTGAGGFIGSHVVRQLLASGHRVRALLRPGETDLNLRGLDVEIVACDVRDATGLERAMQGCELVFHLAAIYALWLPEPDLFRQVNVDGTRNVLTAARNAGVRRVIHTSSIARFGGQGLHRRATEQSPFALGITGDRYSQSKADAHQVALDAAASGQDVVLVAPCGPLGPGDLGPTPTGRLLLACMSLPVITVTRTITNFAHVADMAAAHLRAAEVGVSGQCYLLGNEDLSLARLATMAMQALGVSRPVVEVPWSVARAAGRAALWTTEHLTHKPPLLTPAAAAIAELGLAADCSRAVRELQMPKTPISVALHDAFEWFARHGYLNRGRASRLLSTPART